MGFVFRNTTSFTGARTFLTLYCAFVRSQIEFGTLIWNPILQKYSEALEKIQRRFLKYTYYRIFQYYPSDIEYGELLAGFELRALESRRQITQLRQLHSIVTGHNASPLLHEIQLRIPRANARLKETFYINNYRKGPKKHSFIARACSLYNKIEKNAEIGSIDILSQTREEFERYLAKI